MSPSRRLELPSNRTMLMDPVSAVRRRYRSAPYIIIRVSVTELRSCPTRPALWKVDPLVMDEAGQVRAVVSTNGTLIDQKAAELKFGTVPSLEKELAAVRHENDETRRQIEFLRKEVQHLKDDPTAVERIARDELGLVRKNEVVFQFPERRPAP